MQYIEAPKYTSEIDKLPEDKCLFIAGSITGAWDWQKEIVHKEYERNGNKIRVLDIFHCFNPRRANFDTADESETEKQIKWEYKCIHRCANILFWFSHETLAPITLFELGSALATHENIFIGIDPKYQRKDDVIIQTGLREQKLADSIVFSLDDLAKKVIESGYGFSTFFKKKKDDRSES